MNEILGAVVGLLVLAGVAWFCWAADRAEAQDQGQLAREIESFPPDVRAQLWAAYHRQQAERDLY